MRTRTFLAVAAVTATCSACGSGSSHGAASDAGESSDDRSAPGDDSGSSDASGGSSSGDSASSSSGSSSGSNADSGSGSDAASSGAGDSGTADSGAPPVSGPCDILAAGGTACVAAHSTVRALYGAYAGNLYQVKRASDMTTKDIGLTGAGGFADSSSQDAFCASTTCIISMLYDQSPKGNHLTPAPGGGEAPGADKPANATDLKITVSGHSVYGIRIHAGMGYRDDKTAGIATGDQPETEYMVTGATYANSGCCFDYGNAETDNHDDNAGTMEAVYFGTANGGSGSGPWVEADLENGLFAGGAGGKVPGDMTLNSDFVTAVVIGRSGSFALEGSDATSGMLQTMYDGTRPSGYNPMKKEGAIILGIGGDNSNSSTGTFYEGVMTSGAATNATMQALQRNIVAAQYGK